MIQEKPLEELQYPIGKFEQSGEITADQVKHWMDEIAALPDELAQAVEGLIDEQLDPPYRPGGWTVRHVVYHAAHITSLRESMGW